MTHKTHVVPYLADPLNLGAAPERLHTSVITPVSSFFVRNHAPIPEIAPDAFRLAVDGLVARPLALSLDDLQQRFPVHTVTATLQCAGNRRRDLAQWEPIDSGEIIWDADAISTAEWTGVRLCDILQAAGPSAGAAHVAFLGLDHVDVARDGFGGSIPLDKASSAEVLLAYRMNGEPLPPTHGYPLRALAPGYIGARSVKWLSRITVQAEPSANYYQAHAYKLFPPAVRADTVNWDEGEMLGPLPINAIIYSPRPGEHLAGNRVTVRGIALPGDDAVIERVELSCDDGRTWQCAALTSPPQQWTWCLWESECSLPPGAHRLVVRAFDSAGHVQPAELGDVWNFKGYVNNAYHRVDVVCTGAPMG